MSAEHLRLRALALALTLLSGATMMLAGYIGHTDSWATAGFIAIAGGAVIFAAFAVSRRAERGGDQTVDPSNSYRTRGAGATAATLLSGGVMVLAGYAGSAWGWGLAGLLAAVGGLVAGGAFLLDRGSGRGSGRSW